MDQAAQIFGPAQMAVAKAVAGFRCRGIIPREKAEDLLVIVSVFIHPQAKDYDAIYRLQLRGHEAGFAARHGRIPGYR